MKLGQQFILTVSYCCEVSSDFSTKKEINLVYDSNERDQQLEEEMLGVKRLFDFL